MTLLVLACGGPLRAQILDWAAALAELGGGQSVFSTVGARPGDATGQPAHALVGGNFQGDFQLGQLRPLPNAAGQDGVVARLDQQPGPLPAWEPVWQLHAESFAGDVTITDLALTEGGVFYISGFFRNDVTFSPGGPSFGVPGLVSGFVAWGDANAGTWQGAFETPGLEPRSLALGPGANPDIFLTGPGALARSYDPAGNQIWDLPVPAGVASFAGIALSDDPAAPDLFVLVENSSFAQGVVLHRLDRATGADALNWQRRMGGQGNEFAGGLAVPADGHPRVAFSTQDPNPLFGTEPLPALPNIGAEQSLLLRVDPAGGLVWATPLGLAQDAVAFMKPVDVAVDAAGNAFATGLFGGSFVIEAPQPVSGNNDAAVLGVDAAGVLFDFHRTAGTGTAQPRALSAPVRELLVTVGGYDGEPSFGGILLPLADAGEPRAFFGVVGPIDGQQRWILKPDPASPAPPDLPTIIEQIHQLGGQLYSVVRYSQGDLAVGAWIDDNTLTQFPAGIILEEDLETSPDGTSADSGWALAHLNDANTPAAGTYSFTYPEPGHTVFVYLLDTAIDNSSGFFTPNTSLTVEPTTLVRGIGDPLVSSVFRHGTEMLSLIGGPGTGAAVGTPILLKNFDFYPNGSTTTASLLAGAIYEAIDYHEAHGECFPGIIVVASSSVAAASSATLSGAVDEAVAAGLPVVLSAGNAGADASLYVPASKGTVDGVLCVGASKMARTIVATSNFGTPIDFYAPGDSVRVIDFGNPLGGGFGSFTGTSASCALAGAVAATYLSVNPWSTPSALESAIAGDLHPAAGGGTLDILQLSPSGPGFYLDYLDWTAFFELTDIAHTGDDDGDGWINYEEFFHGLKPTEFEPKGSQTSISYDLPTDHYIYAFNVSSVLLDPANPGTLLDGTTYVVKESTTLESFGATGNALSVGTTTGMQTSLSETATTSSECYFRVEITPAAPSP